MKLIKTLIAACLLTAFSGIAGELSDADQKWSKAVERMISHGSTTISTPQENRVRIAKKLAAKFGRETKVEKTKKSYKIIVSAATTKSASVSKDN